MKKCLIIYYSYHHGNTKKIADAMAGKTDAKLCPVDEISENNIEDYELIGFGSGIAFGKHYKKLTDEICKLNLQGKKVFVFSTSGVGSAKSNIALIELLKNMGAFVVGDFACKGYDTYGPFKLIGGTAKGHPDDDDIAAAEKFIKGIAE
jgi:flavodoxin